MDIRKDQAGQGRSPQIDDLATRRILARVSVSPSLAKVLADLAYRPNADAWQRGRV